MNTLVHEMEKVKHANSKAGFQEALLNSNVQYILYEPSVGRQLFFKVERSNQGAVQAIFYENLGRGLPAAADIEEAIIEVSATNPNLLSNSVQFKDVSRQKRLQSFYQAGGEFNFTNPASSIGMFSGKQSNNDGDSQLLPQTLIIQAMKDFEAFKNFDFKKTIDDLARELEKKRIECEDSQLRLGS